MAELYGVIGLLSAAATGVTIYYGDWWFTAFGAAGTVLWFWFAWQELNRPRRYGRWR